MTRDDFAVNAKEKRVTNEMPWGPLPPEDRKDKPKVSTRKMSWRRWAGYDCGE